MAPQYMAPVVLKTGVGLEGSDAKLALARHWMSQEMPAEAIPLYWDAIVLKPAPSLIYEFGNVLRGQDMLEEEAHLYEQALEAEIWKHTSQRPMHYIIGLRAQPWWDPQELPLVLGLEQSYLAIKEEMFNLVANGQFSEYSSNAVVAGEWSDFTLFWNGKPVEDHCAACPQTVAAVRNIPGATTASKGNVYFSRLAPDTHIRQHCGPTNSRLRVHLGLQVPLAPQAPKIRVGDETRHWEEGSCLVFDDSFEHEVWNYGEERIVLIVDMWHPELETDEQRLAASSTPLYT